MKYIDSINDYKDSQLLNQKEKQKAICEARKLIASVHELMDKVICWRKHNLEQISLYSNSEKFPSLKEYVEFMTHQNELIDISIQLMLFYGDIMIAYKNIQTIYDDWEIRVHIRRVYTLLYEISMGFCRNAGKPIGYLKAFIEYTDKNVLDTYGSWLNQLKGFLASHKDELSKIRNKTEAHKDSDVCVQVSLIENISIRTSTSIINKAIEILNQVLRSMSPLFIQFNRRLMTIEDSIISN